MNLKCLDKQNLKHKNVVRAKAILDDLSIEEAMKVSKATTSILMYAKSLISYYEILVALGIVKVTEEEVKASPVKKAKSPSKPAKQAKIPEQKFKEFMEKSTSVLTEYRTILSAQFILHGLFRDNHATLAKVIEG